MAKTKIEYNELVLKVDEDDRILFAEFTSSNLSVLAYDITNKQVIAVFKNSPEKRYFYNDVPAKTFFEVMSAKSVGSAFSKLIVKGDFAFYDEPNK